MVDDVTIDAAGRLVIPKTLRDRLRLQPGTRLWISERDGRIVLDPEQPAPRLVERDGFLVIELEAQLPRIDTDAARDERLRHLVEYALRR
jgi:AbrB family looped-hinge helix DNA binding protein